MPTSTSKSDSPTPSALEGICARAAACSKLNIAAGAACGKGVAGIDGHLSAASLTGHSCGNGDSSGFAG